MSNLEKLNNYIDHLQREKAATHLVNDADNTELARAMKTARDIHAHSEDKKPDPFFVNALEEEILVMNEEGHGVRLRRSWFFRVIPALGIAAIAVVVTVGLLQPESDKNNGTERSSTVTTRVEQTFNNPDEEPLELSPVPVVVTTEDLQELELLAQETETFMNETDTNFNTLEQITNDPVFASSVSEIQLSSF